MASLALRERHSGTPIPKPRGRALCAPRPCDSEPFTPTGSAWTNPLFDFYVFAFDFCVFIVDDSDGKVYVWLITIIFLYPRFATLRAKAYKDSRFAAEGTNARRRSRPTRARA